MDCLTLEEFDVLYSQMEKIPKMDEDLFENKKFYNQFIKCNYEESLNRFFGCEKYLENFYLRFTFGSSEVHKLLNQMNQYERNQITLQEFNKFILRRKTFIPKKTSRISMSIFHEEECLRLFARKNPSLIVRQPGRMVNPNFPILSAKPDGIIIEKGVMQLIEIKVPQNLYWMSFEDWDHPKVFTSKFDNGKVYFQLRQNNYNYDQIQLTLYAANCHVCRLLIYCPYTKEYKEIAIRKNSIYCSNLIDKIQYLYKNYYINICNNYIEKNKIWKSLI